MPFAKCRYAKCHYSNVFALFQQNRRLMLLQSMSKNELQIHVIIEKYYIHFLQQTPNVTTRGRHNCNKMTSNIKTSSLIRKLYLGYFVNNHSREC